MGILGLELGILKRNGSLVLDGLKNVIKSAYLFILNVGTIFEVDLQSI